MINLLDFTKMKKLLFLLFTLSFLLPTFGQQELKRADSYFDRAFYYDAIPLYEQLLVKNKNSKLIKNLADSYYHTFDMKQAARWYTYLISNYGEQVDKNYYFKLNQSLKAIGDYGSANEVLSNYYTKIGEKDKLDLLKNEILYLENVKAIGQRFDIKNLEFNTSSSEFGAMQIHSNIMHTASRKQANTLSKLYRWNHQNYLDIYTHPLDKLQFGDSLSVALSKNINTKKHEGTFAITKDEKTLYFTRNSSKKTKTDKVSNLKIYKAELIDGVWKDIVALPFNGDNFSTEHPALNNDETKLYFASDCEGGHGSFDIYSVTIQGDGSYGNPVNLGKQINTDKKEQFPFLDLTDNLYFASNGHPGFGLLDIFIAKKKKDGFTKPDNLGLPINSGYDDFSLSLNTDKKSGYFSSNRPTGKGSDDIYSFLKTRPLIIENCKQFIAGIVTDKTSQRLLANASIQLLDADGKVLENSITAADASFKFTVSCESNYRIEATKEGYEANFKTVRTDKERNLTKDASITLFSVREREKQEVAALQKKIEEAEKKAIGETKRKLKKEKAAKEARTRKEEQLLENEKIAQEKATKKRLQKIEAAIQKEEAIVKEKDRTLIKTEEIHFDYSLWYLRRESRQRLQKVIETLKKNPGIVLEIATHTDIRGNSEYNRDLSQKRADAVKDFLVKNGIADDRVIAKGYGESAPMVKCEPETACTEEDHEWNRRCELVIVRWD